ncbi:MAG: endolytic transglycosylase MltG [bacterium]
MSKTKKIIWSIILVVGLSASIMGINLYSKLFKNNISEDAAEYLYIPTGSSIDDVERIIKENNVLLNTETFKWVASQLKYKNIKPGKYKIKQGMSNVELVRKLRAGDQEVVKLSFQNFRLISEFAGYVGKQLECDSAEIISKLDSIDLIREYGFNEENIFCMFIPNTYEFYWNTSALKFIDKMNEQYVKFWTEDRIAKAKKIGLTKVEVSVLASIVDQEALVNKEMKTIAGVYMNRINRGMKLEADPTVIFAIGNFNIKRVLNKMLAHNSPYNTYKYNGLPPGPICMPSIAAIDAVLSYEKHNYIYFCAKEDFSGYHNYASNLAEHKKNAKKFQLALSKRGIMK